MRSPELLNPTVADPAPTDSADESFPSAAPLQMHGLVYRGPGRRAWEERPRPVLREPTDAIVHVTTSTICGTDLHILKGDVPSVTEGRILGHEGVGVVTEVGAGVTTFRAGDRVLISCITSCGRCDFCRRQMYSHCRHGGWILGNTIDGTQADYVRIPHADTSLYAIPADGDEEALVMLSDILPTGFECGVLNGQVRPGDIVAIVGAGPVGLAALLTAQFYSPASIVMVDLDDKRLEVARTFGATALINSSDGGAVQRIMDLTEGHGVDVAIEAVGVPATFDICQAILAPGGRLANVGVHGAAGDTASRETVGPQHHHHHSPGRHDHDPDAAEGRGVWPASAAKAGHAPLRARRHHARVRDVRTRGEGGRAEGHSHERDPWMTARGAVTPSRAWALAPAAGRRRTRTRVLGDCALRSGRRSLRRPIG